MNIKKDRHNLIKGSYSKKYTLLIKFSEIIIKLLRSIVKVGTKSRRGSRHLLIKSTN